MSVTNSVRVGPKGRIVIPAAVRDELNIHEGDELAMIVEGHGVRFISRERLIDELKRTFAHVKHSLADELIADRHAEAARDAG